MSTMRQIDTRFWADTWVRRLNALDRYAFIYFLTNSHSSWCGVYELDISMASFESGIDAHDLEKAILPKLLPKIVYVDGWVYIANFQKYHENGSAQTKKGIENAWLTVPDRIRLKIEEIGCFDIPPIDPLVGGCSSSSSSSSSSSFSSKEEMPNGIVSGKDYKPDHTPPKRKTKILTNKQKIAVKRMKALSYFHEQGIKNGFNYLLEEDDQANRKFIGLARAFEKRYPDNWKEVIDWWFASDNAWCDYHPSNFFSVSSWMKFDNKSNKSNIIQL